MAKKRKATRDRQEPKGSMPTRPAWPTYSLAAALIIGGAVGAVATTGIASLTRRVSGAEPRLNRDPEITGHLRQPDVTGPEELLGASPDRLAQHDIAEINSAAAGGLPGGGPINRQTLRLKLDRWTDRVRSETARHLPRFRANPADYNNSEAYFRALMLVTVLQQDCGVHYNTSRIHQPDARDARDLFLHGLVAGNGGTCASMPVLYVAIGRRLGYPLKLVPAKAHLFARWDDGKERFNIEATNQGLNPW